ncbi:MAG: rRNA cytosine-C5-methyltransferase, partial [Candidatus Bacteroides intestinipullorum]|nr:rRNA cytosine-C5-methyltransferase [Candidatus Bacteroides intestinipullorum]
ALGYLRREPLVLPVDTPRGFVLLTWGGLPLGFAKHIGSRANNLYPQEWRIRLQA